MKKHNHSRLKPIFQNEKNGNLLSHPLAMSGILGKYYQIRSVAQ